ncbi:MAG TPA: endonuclease/exonuclease/phosphatase family protein [Planctomycetota bacterium]|nr:endonuclease/exonuclease/phosphatase family protein [Planctomycetota bacterium]
MSDPGKEHARAALPADRPRVVVKTRWKRRLERVAAWSIATLAWLLALLGLIGPLLGGSGPGLQGPIGFAAETIAAMWVQGGLLATAFLAVALVRRHWRPAAALAPIALFALLPELCVCSRPLDDPLPGDGRPLRVATISLEKENKEDPLMEACLREIDADVLVLLEVTKPWATRLEQWFCGDYPHRWLAAAPEHPHAREELQIAVWSRLPAAGDHEVWNLGKYNSQIRVPLRWRDRVFALYGIHPRKPFPFAVYSRAWRDRQQVLDWIGRERLPMVVAGDFNATPRSAFVHRLRQLGLANASEAVCGSAPVTWPMHPGLLVPFRVALDHVMHTEEFTAIAFRRGVATNSAHSSICAELVWRTP